MWNKINFALKRYNRIAEIPKSLCSEISIPCFILFRSKIISGEKDAPKETNILIHQTTHLFSWVLQSIWCQLHSLFLKVPQPPVVPWGWVWNSPLHTCSFSLFSSRERATPWRRRGHKWGLSGEREVQTSQPACTKWRFCHCHLRNSKSAHIISPRSGTSAVYSRYPPGMPTSTSSSLLNNLDRREDETPQLVTWKWASFLCLCFEMNKGRTKKKK